MDDTFSIAQMLFVNMACIVWIVLSFVGSMHVELCAVRVLRTTKLAFLYCFGVSILLVLTIIVLQTLA